MFVEKWLRRCSVYHDGMCFLQLPWVVVGVSGRDVRGGLVEAAAVIPVGSGSVSLDSAVTHLRHYAFVPIRLRNFYEAPEIRNSVMSRSHFD